MCKLKQYFIKTNILNLSLHLDVAFLIEKFYIKHNVRGVIKLNIKLYSTLNKINF